MNKKADFETIRRAFAVFNDDGGPSRDELWWRTDGEYAPISLIIDCSDVFFWGRADCEDLTPDNIGELERAVADYKAVDPLMDSTYAHLLFCARLRGMRPHVQYYEHFPEETWSLFDACGPVRE
jgi:hypothetical protein